jgi:hypothetical protein
MEQSVPYGGLANSLKSICHGDVAWNAFEGLAQLPARSERTVEASNGIASPTVSGVSPLGRSVDRLLNVPEVFGRLGDAREIEEAGAAVCVSEL